MGHRLSGRWGSRRAGIWRCGGLAGAVVKASAAMSWRLAPARKIWRRRATRAGSPHRKARQPVSLGSSERRWSAGATVTSAGSWADGLSTQGRGCSVGCVAASWASSSR